MGCGAVIVGRLAPGGRHQAAANDKAVMATRGEDRGVDGKPTAWWVVRRSNYNAPIF